MLNLFSSTHTSVPTMLCTVSGLHSGGGLRFVRLRSREPFHICRDTGVSFFLSRHTRAAFRVMLSIWWKNRVAGELSPAGQQRVVWSHTGRVLPPEKLSGGPLRFCAGLARLRTNKDHGVTLASSVDLATPGEFTSVECHGAVRLLLIHLHLRRGHSQETCKQGNLVEGKRGADI